MTKHPSIRRRTARETRRIRVTTQADEKSTSKPVQILTNAALQQARREAEAAAEHALRVDRLDHAASTADWASKADEVANRA